LLTPVLASFGRRFPAFGQDSLGDEIREEPAKSLDCVGGPRFVGRIRIDSTDAFRVIVAWLRGAIAGIVLSHGSSFS